MLKMLCVSKMHQLAFYQLFVFQIRRQK